LLEDGGPDLGEDLLLDAHTGFSTRHLDPGGDYGLGSLVLIVLLIPDIAVIVCGN